jgi:hypothetical protein
MVGPGGLIAVRTASPAEWAYRSGLVDPRSGAIHPIPLNFEGETLSPVWTREGKLVAEGDVVGLSLWHFQAAR